MSTRLYTVTSKSGANLREFPSGSFPTSKPVGYLGYLSTVTVITDWHATNVVGDATAYLPCLVDDKVRYVSKTLVGTLSNLERMQLATPYCYETIYHIKSHHVNGKGTTLENIITNKENDCIGAVTACATFAGLVAAGHRIGHTKADGKDGATKKTPESAIKNMSKLIAGTYTIVDAHKCFKDLSPKHQQAGMIYVQDSNICVSAGNGKIYSCNQTGKTYGKGGEAVLRTSGYPFNHKILYIIVPKG